MNCKINDLKNGDMVELEVTAAPPGSGRIRNG